MGYPSTQTGVVYYVGTPEAQEGERTAIRQTVQIEVYLDYVCPFSAKMFLTLEKLWPKLSSKKNAFFVFHQMPQPWHPQGVYCHEAALVVRKLGTAKQFFDFSSLLFKDQTKFFDDGTWDKSRAQIYEELSSYVEAVGIEKEQFLSHVGPNEKVKKEGFLNYGNAVTNDLKYSVKLQRKRGVHGKNRYSNCHPLYEFSRLITNYYASQCLLLYF